MCGRPGRVKAKSGIGDDGKRPLIMGNSNLSNFSKRRAYKGVAAAFDTRAVVASAGLCDVHR